VFRSGSGGAESGWAVFRIDNGRARLQPVEIGLQGEGRVEILSGLQAQDRVVLHPSRDLTDGSRVHHP
jgi:HlyD family secretion protein